MFKIGAYIVSIVGAIYFFINYLNAKQVLNLRKYNDEGQRAKSKRYFFWLTVFFLLFFLSELLSR
jgi:Na+-driven multidrug efflux pump